MMHGLTESQLQFLIENAVSKLKEAGATVYLFGSRARGTHQQFSDIDLLVESKGDLSSLISHISENLESSNFPFKVDIVQSKALADSYRPSVDSDKILL